MYLIYNNKTGEIINRQSCSPDVICKFNELPTYLSKLDINNQSVVLHEDYVVNNKIVTRPSFPITYPEPDIVYTLNTKLIFKNIPIGTKLNINELPYATLDSSTLEILLDHVGSIKLGFVKFPYLTLQVTYHAIETE